MKKESKERGKNMSKFLNAKIPYNFLHKKIIAHAGKNSGLFSVGSSGSLEPLNFTNVLKTQFPKIFS